MPVVRAKEGSGLSAPGRDRNERVDDLSLRRCDPRSSPRRHEPSVIDDRRGHCLRIPDRDGGPVASSGSSSAPGLSSASARPRPSWNIGSSVPGITGQRPSTAVIRIRTGRWPRGSRHRIRRHHQLVPGAQARAGRGRRSGTWRTSPPASRRSTSAESPEQAPVGCPPAGDGDCRRDALSAHPPSVWPWCMWAAIPWISSSVSFPLLKYLLLLCLQL